MMLIKLAVGGLMVVAAVMGIASRVGTASAQYPPPTGSCVLTVSATTINVNGTVEVVVTVLDVNGKPAAGVPIDLVVSRQPGTDASISGNASATDSNGQVRGTLNVGTASGTVTVTASTADVSCAGTVVVGQEAVLGQVVLPNTGGGSGSAGDASGVLAAFLLGAAGLASVAAGANWRRRRRAQVAPR